MPRMPQLTATLLLLPVLLLPALLPAAPLRVALLDFEDQTGVRPDAGLAGPTDPARLAARGMDLLSGALLDRQDFVLIDRRDFIGRITTPTPPEARAGTPRPGFIQAAQLMGADAVLTGGLTSFSTRKESINQAGYAAEFTRLDLRVTLRALSVVDGAVIAVADGHADESFRQTATIRSELGEEDALRLMETALAQAVPKLVEALERYQVADQRPRVRISVDSTANPALVEIDGVLVGSTPILGLEVYQGDHTLAVTRPGYEPMAKRLVLDRDFEISVPMFRTDLSAEERKAILEGADMKAYLFNGRPDILIQELGP